MRAAFLTVLLLVPLAGCSSPTAPPASGNVQGLLIDQRYRPVDANVSLDEHGPWMLTQYGQFRLDAIAAGAHTLHIAVPGKRPVQMPVDVPAGGTLDLGVTLVPG